MQETWKAARVGLMVIVGTFVAIAVYRYVDERSGANDGYTVYAMFDDVQGLIPKSRVLIAGIPVGYIDTIRLDGHRARVDIRINSDVVLYEDARIAMRSASLLGEKLLVINPGSVTEPEIPDGGQILEAREPTSMDAILETVSEIATNVRDVSVQMQRSFGTDEAGERMQNALLNLSEALEAVNRTIQSNEAVVGNTLRNVENATEAAGPRLIRILDNVESATRNLEQVIDERRPDIDRAVGEADDTVASIHRASEELERVLADVRQVTDRTARGEGTVGRLTNDETLIDEVEGITEGLGDIIGGIGRLQTILEIRSEYNMLANTFKTYFSLRLQPRESRYFLIQVVDDPRGSESTRRETVFQNPAGSEDPPVYTRTTITRSDALRFTIMLAKRVSVATFRVGIMESTGGLGLDLHLLDDRFEFNLDAFAIGVQALPRLRARLNFELVNRFWLVAGVDDALNGTRDVFLGLMLRFNDDDLKSILPFAGGLTP
ncbi:MAG: MlaD family protein [Polyangiales bacterium]|nr:MCE family protein [Myxococcales bacterium]MCB9657025.1 MCE family protein [Sandaracinaceae bacterium]